jgi:integrase
MNKLFITLCAILSQAWEDCLIPNNPMSRIKAPRPDTEEKEALPPSELFALLDKLDALPMDGRIMAVYFIACLGLRRGEACAVYGSDMHDGLITIDKAIKERDGTIGAPKSPSGIRTLPMPERLQNKVLEWLRLRDTTLKGCKTICCNTQGGVLRPQLLQRWWSGDAYHNGIRESLGCPDITLHQLRHSNLSMMARHMSPFDLKTYAGWASIEPAKIYIHDDLKGLRKAVNDVW